MAWFAFTELMYNANYHQSLAETFYANEGKLMSIRNKLHVIACYAIDKSIQAYYLHYQEWQCYTKLVYD